MDSDDTGTTVSNLAWYGRGKSNKVLKSDSALLEDYFKKRPELMERIQRLRSHKRRRMPDGVLVEDYTFGLALYTSLYKRGSWKVRCIKARLNHRNLLQLSERDREDAELCHSWIFGVERPLDIQSTCGDWCYEEDWAWQLKGWPGARRKTQLKRYNRKEKRNISIPEGATQNQRSCRWPLIPVLITITYISCCFLGEGTPLGVLFVYGLHEEWIVFHAWLCCCEPCGPRS